MDSEYEMWLNRRYFLYSTSITTATGLAGCASILDGDGDGNTGGTTPTSTDTPEPTPTQEPTPDSTPEPTPTQDGSPDYILPDNIDEDDFEALLENIDEEEAFIESVGFSEGPIPQPGEQTVQGLLNIGGSDRDTIAGMIAERSGVDSSDALVINAYPDSEETFRNALLENGLANSEKDGFGELKQFEEDLYNLWSPLDDGIFRDDEYRENFLNSRWSLLENGISENGIKLLSLQIQYGGEQINGHKSRVQQAKENNLWTAPAENGEITGDVIEQLQDTTGYGLIDAEDPYPEQVSGSNDLIPTEVKMFVLPDETGPGEDTVLLYHERTSEADPDKQDAGIQRTVDEYGRYDTNAFASRGDTDLDPFGSEDEFQEFVKSNELGNEGLGMMYVCFDDQVSEENTGLNWKDHDGFNYAFVETYWGKEFVEYLTAHEVGEMTGGRDVAWLDKNNPDGKGKNSLMSHNTENLGNLKYLKGDDNTFEDNNYNQRALDMSGLERLLKEGKTLGDEHNITHRPS